jgi:hypothetical protein
MAASVPGEVAGRPTWLSWRIAGHPVRQLTLFFLLSLPLINPYVHGDGVGYYAYVRAPLIQHNLRFEEDWRHANEYFAQARVRPDGQLLPNQYTQTGYVGNLFTVGPAILWSPFLLSTHAVVLTINHFGGSIPTDGFSRPYRVAMALGTAFYGFLGLLFSFLLACQYVEERWAFLATLGIWAASSLPVYMYFNPAWSHAHSAFVVALFLWFWESTRPNRTIRQWFLLGLIAGLMLDTYFPNGAILVIPLAEALRDYFRSLRLKSSGAVLRQFGKNAVFVLALSFAVLPTLLTRAIIFGGPFRLGAYSVLPWDWTAPNWRPVLFSSNHGLLTWTPLLLLALVGLLLADRRGGEIAPYGVGAFLGFYYVIASYPYWDGFSSFGNRFFVSLTPVFVLGLAFLFQRLGHRFQSPRRGFALLAVLVVAFSAWNGGFIFQWGTHLVPARGEISWRAMVHNQFFVVPGRLEHGLEAYFLHRNDMMKNIEQGDIEQQQEQQKAHEIQQN